MYLLSLSILIPLMVQSDIADDELAEVVISDKDCGETVEVDN